MAILTPPALGSESSKRVLPVSDASFLGRWRLLGWLGLAFVVMGGTDISLAWYPAAFGVAEWEFGAISASLNGFALPMLGLYFVLCGATARHQVSLARVVGCMMIALGIGFVVLAFLYATVVPLALTSVADNPQLTIGMRKAVVKAAMLFVTYTALLVAGGVHAWRVRETD